MSQIIKLCGLINIIRQIFVIFHFQDVMPRRHDGDYEGMESYLKTRIAWLDKTMKNMDEQIEK